MKAQNLITLIVAIFSENLQEKVKFYFSQFAQFNLLFKKLQSKIDRYIFLVTKICKMDTNSIWVQTVLVLNFLSKQNHKKSFFILFQLFSANFAFLRPLKKSFRPLKKGICFILLFQSKFYFFQSKFYFFQSKFTFLVQILLSCTNFTYLYQLYFFIPILLFLVRPIIQCYLVP